MINCTEKSSKYNKKLDEENLTKVGNAVSPSY
jgi:hypothetical protein